MKPRFDYAKAAPGAYQAMLGLEKYLHDCGLEAALVHLVKLRASQLNGCAYCLDMHWKDARAGGEPEDRLYALGAWEESPLYSERERAALGLCEAMTLIAGSHVPDAVWDRATTHFDPEELAQLVFAIAAINTWNRLAITVREPPGTYRPTVKEA